MFAFFRDAKTADGAAGPDAAILHKEASDSTNTGSLADDLERGLVAKLVADSTLTEVSDTIERNGSRIF